VPLEREVIARRANSKKISERNARHALNQEGKRLTFYDGNREEEGSTKNSTWSGTLDNDSVQPKKSFSSVHSKKLAGLSLGCQDGSRVGGVSGEKCPLSYRNWEGRYVARRTGGTRMRQVRGSGEEHKRE